jgi:hypothetical protein
MYFKNIYDIYLSYSAVLQLKLQLFFFKIRLLNEIHYQII